MCVLKICFKYPNERYRNVRIFNLDIPTGKRVAIVDEIGQGKTTIFNLPYRHVLTGCTGYF